MEHHADASRAQGRRHGPVVAGAMAGLLVLLTGAVACGGPDGSGGAGGTTPSPTVVTASSGAATTQPAATAEPSSGDLRPFLLATPEGASTSGEAPGEALALADLTEAEKAELPSYGFTSAARRTYLTADGTTEVSVLLQRFADAPSAARYYAGHDYGATPAVITTLGHPAKAYDLRSGAAESTDAMIGVSYRGDVQFSISVTGAGSSARTLVTSLLGEQYQLLPTAG